MIKYKNEWGEDVTLYTEELPLGVKLTFSKKNRSDIFCIPWDDAEKFWDDLTNLINNRGEE